MDGRGAVRGGGVGILGCRVEVWEGVKFGDFGLVGRAGSFFWIARNEKGTTFWIRGSFRTECYILSSR